MAGLCTSSTQQRSLLGCGTGEVLSPCMDRVQPRGSFPELLMPCTCWGTLEGSPQLASCREQEAPPDLQGMSCRSANAQLHLQFLPVNNQKLPYSCHSSPITTSPVIRNKRRRAPLMKLLKAACSVPRQMDRLSLPSPSPWVRASPPARLTNVHRGVVSLDVFI